MRLTDVIPMVWTKGHTPRGTFTFYDCARAFAVEQTFDIRDLASPSDCNEIKEQINETIPLSEKSNSTKNVLVSLQEGISLGGKKILLLLFVFK